MCPARVQRAFPGRRVTSRWQGWRGLERWEGRHPAHPSAPGQYPAAHRTPECSCQTVAWIWRGWTLRSRSKTCGDNDKSGQRGTALDRSACHCPSMSAHGVAHSGPLPGRPHHPRLSTLLTIDSGLPPLHWSGLRRPPPRAHWGPAAASSPPPPAPSCQLQPQRGPSPGPAEDPQGPRPGQAARPQRRRSLAFQRVPAGWRSPRAPAGRGMAAAGDVAGSGSEPDSLTREVEPRAPPD